MLQRSRFPLFTLPLLGMLAASLMAARPLDSSTADLAHRHLCAGSLSVPLEVGLETTAPAGALRPGDTTTLRVTVTPKSDVGVIDVSYDAVGARLPGGAGEQSMAPAQAGQARLLDLPVVLSADGRSQFNVHVKAQNPAGGDAWERNESYFAIYHDGRTLTGMGSFLQLDLQAVEEDFRAGKITEEAARAATRRLLTLPGRFDQAPRPARALTIREQEYSQALAPAALPGETPLQSSPITPNGAGCITVQGNVSWLDENGVSHPAFGMTVQVRDDDTIGSELVAFAATDVNGNYSFLVDNDDGIGAGDRDIFVRILTFNNAVSIEPAGIFTEPYQVDSSIHDETPCNTTITENFTCDNTGTGPACNLCEGGSWIAVYTAQNLNGGSFLGQIVMEWPGDTGSANYDGGDINLRPGDRWDWDVLQHEYGHYIQDHFDTENNPGGPHNIGDCVSDVHSSKSEGVRLAWGEGWPTYNMIVGGQILGLSSLNVPRVGDVIYADTGESNFSYSLETQDSNGQGEDNEVAVQRLLFDLWDGAADGFENTSNSDASLFTPIDADNSETLSSAWAAYRAGLSNQQQLDFGMAAANQLIGPTLNQPAANAIVSPSANNVLTWNRNVGCSSTYDGDSFTLRFFNAATAAPLLSIPVGNTTSHALTLAELTTLVASTHDVRWAVEGSNGDSPATGPYLGENRAVVVNRPPVADAGPDQPNVECTSATTTPVQLNGTGSSDPDGDPLTYTWTATGVSFNNNHSATPIGQFPMGTTLVTLTVSDGIEEDTDTVSITVVDTTPPVITCPVDVVIECNDHCAGGGVPKDDAQLTAFFAGASAVDVCDPTPVLTNDAPDCFPLGPTLVTFTATDDDHNASSCGATVTVVDTTPPTITVELNRDALWPPNHKMVPIAATVTVTDVCDPHPTFVLTSITSNEPDNGTGDGNFPNDIQGADLNTADTDFLLRAERMGGGTGRIYTIIFTASDESGNTTPDTVYVRVPHDQSGHALAAAGFEPTGTAITPQVASYQLVIFSQPGLDARGVDTRYATVGNDVDAVRPLLARLVDLNGDRKADLQLTYDAAATLAIRAQSNRRNPLGLHYRLADGTDCLVPDIFALGTPVAVLAAGDGGDTGGGTQIIDGAQDPNANVAVDPDDASRPDTPPADVTPPAAPGPNAARILLAEATHVTVQVFSVTGRRITTLLDDARAAGPVDVAWDGRDDSGRRMPAGIYFYRFQAGAASQTRKVLLSH